tara:strand:- start:218 stop:607 length:390 start_codon:yes stop_codon:yes gene_type:complete
MALDNKDVKIKDFRKILNEEQKVTYDEITKERLYIYFTGYLIGIICGYLYYLKYPNDNVVVCKIIAIILSVKLMVYKLYPKKPLMLYSLTTKEQVSAWADVYTIMKKKWMISIIFGFIGAIILSYSFTK